MEQVHYKPDSWFWAVVLQADWRLQLVLMRSGPRGWTIPPGFLVRAVTLVLCAAWLRLGGSATVTFEPLSIVDWPASHLVERGAWAAYLLASVAVTWPVVAANRRRARNGTETEDELSWYFRGWPRLMSWDAFSSAGCVERQNLWWRSTVVYEPVVGLAGSAILGLASPWLGLYVAVNVLWLWKESIASSRASTLHRRKLLEAVLERAYMQRLVEEVDDRHQVRTQRDGRARLA